MRPLYQLIAVLCLWAVPQGAVSSPPSPEQRLERGVLCLEVMDYPCVDRELQALKGQYDGLSAAQKQGVAQLLVESLLSQKKWELARQELKVLLTLNPDFRPKKGAWPPKWNELYEETLSLLPDASPPIVTLVDVSPQDATGPWTIRVELRDPSGIGTVKLFVRQGSVTHELLMATSNGIHWQASVPNLWASRTQEGSATLSFWGHATALNGNGPGTLGSAKTPKTVQFASAPPAPQGATTDDDSILSKWWFWTALGSAAVVSGVTVYLLSSDSGTSAPLPYGTGNLRVNIAWP